MGNQEKISVFFDESGKRQTKLKLMGGLSIPAKIYSLPAIESFSQMLKDGKLELLWKEVTGSLGNRNNIIKKTWYC
ncbi:hypothetical protein [Calidifontibacillus erzurumensis]|uniref:Uncharacterized protein n=1 Tax=Calidifontibacillus erzurumensis TaxID=2741433 RepID=A0A8J8K9I5_9BACI|nr:hypothetical protein [Calidifontibacillus erzurumensis]NSL53211.1 hypothetical protein [Calidifontibacillus erzurumensis]